MAKYRVLKEYVDPTSRLLHNVGDTVEFLEYHKSESDHQLQYYRSLRNNGFIEEIEDEPWEPKNGEEYAFITDSGVIAIAEQLGTHSDNSREEIGNKFKRGNGQAEKVVKWLRAFKVLRDDTKGFKPDLEDYDEKRWYIWWNIGIKKLITTCNDNAIQHLVYFATEADAMESMKNHKEEWLTFFGVEDDNE